MSSLRMSRPRLLALGGAAIAAAAAITAVLALTASAHSSGRDDRTVSATNGQVGHHHERIAVDDHGRAVYTLSSDTTGHRTCSRANGCFSVWPPVTVSGGSPSHDGISGRFGVTRAGGVSQVTLNGHPLYRFAGDHGRDSASGDEIHSFGGTWHVVAGGDDHGGHGSGGSGGSGGPGGGYAGGY